MCFVYMNVFTCCSTVWNCMCLVHVCLIMCVFHVSHPLSRETLFDPESLNHFVLCFQLSCCYFIYMADDNVPSVLTANLHSLPCRWMKKPRCGVPDQMGGAAKFSVRKRRYALTGQKWQHKHITYRWVAMKHLR